MSSKKEMASAWLEAYCAKQVGLIYEMVIPIGIETSFAHSKIQIAAEIGKIYYGEEFSISDQDFPKELFEIASWAGQMEAVKKGALFRATVIMEFPGSLKFREQITSIIKSMGETVIAFYEKHSRASQSAA